MTEGQDIRASHEEIEGFVMKLKGFHGSLGEGERAMMGTILEAAQGGETAGYRWRHTRYGDPEEEGSCSEPSSSGWNDLVGWIEGQGEEDTQGFGFRRTF